MIPKLTFTARDIRKHYGGQPVLRGCSFSFDTSGVYVVMGPNGSGKSTLFRICSLLEDAESGEISYVSNGVPLKKDMSLRRRMTLVLPGIGVFNTSVFNNVAFSLKIRNIQDPERSQRVQDALNIVGLQHKKQQNALTLSSGEIQRLGMARALVINPEILFLDEPTASVDLENVRIIEEIILHLKQEGEGKIILLATHDQAQVDRIGDMLLHLNRGVLSF
jgi:tungstate transport system ATP-binding protein